MSVCFKRELDVLDVERAAAKGQQPSEGLHTVKIALDGQPLKLQHPTGTTDEPTGTHIFKGKHDVQLSIHTNSKIIGSELNERLKVRAGGAHFEMFSKAAEKYKWTANQVKYSHINLNLPHLPSNADGFLAQLAGQRPLSAESLVSEDSACMPNHAALLLRSHGHETPAGLH